MTLLVQVIIILYKNIYSVMTAVCLDDNDAQASFTVILSRIIRTHFLVYALGSLY